MADETTAPTSKALNTTELLEKILLNLPMADMCRVQGVNSYWQTTTSHSSSIRRRLFLDPVSSQDELLDILPTALTIESEELDYDEDLLFLKPQYREDPDFEVRLIHPSLSNIYADHPINPYRRENIITVDPQVEEANRYWSRDITDSSKLLLSPIDSRRPMFATQPPTKTVTLHGAIFRVLFPQQVIENPSGVRLGEISDTIHHCREMLRGIERDEDVEGLVGASPSGMCGRLGLYDEYAL